MSIAGKQPALRRPKEAFFTKEKNGLSRKRISSSFEICVDIEPLATTNPAALMPENCVLLLRAMKPYSARWNWGQEKDDVGIVTEQKKRDTRFARLAMFEGGLGFNDVSSGSPESFRGNCWADCRNPLCGWRSGTSFHRRQKHFHLRQGYGGQDGGRGGGRGSLRLRRVVGGTQAQACGYKYGFGNGRYRTNRADGADGGNGQGGALTKRSLEPIKTTESTEAMELMKR